jgi:uncharacterized protein YbjQ (UPF0145 family)
MFITTTGKDLLPEGCRITKVFGIVSGKSDNKSFSSEVFYATEKDLASKTGEKFKDANAVLGVVPSFETKVQAYGGDSYMHLTGTAVRIEGPGFTDGQT